MTAKEWKARIIKDTIKTNVLRVLEDKDNIMIINDLGNTDYHDSVKFKKKYLSELIKILIEILKDIEVG